MPSKYNVEERKRRLFTAIKMRDAKVERVNHKTGKVEVLRYDPTYVQKVNNLRRFEAVHIGLLKKLPNKIHAELMEAAQKHAFRNRKREERGKKPLEFHPKKPQKHAV